jgi:adenine-specific DNA-methyltransferase
VLGSVRIIEGDALALLPTVALGSVALVVTSPPYDAEKEYEAGRDLVAYRHFARQWTAAIPALLTPTGSFWLNVGYTRTGLNSTLPLTYLYADVVSIPLIQEIVWHYEGGMSYKRRFTHRTERWQWYANDPMNLIFNLDDIRDMSLNRTVDKRNNPLGKNPTDYWFYNRVTNNNKTEKTAHPCQFPEAMVERIILACSNPGDLILDPFAGSGTVGVVAKRLGRNALLFERRPDYCAIATART